MTATPPTAPRSRRSFCSPSRRSPQAQFAAADLPQRLVTATPTVATPPCPCRLCPHGGSTLRATLALPARADSGCWAGRGSHPGRQIALRGPVGGQDASYDHQHRPLRAPPCPPPHRSADGADGAGVGHRDSKQCRAGPGGSQARRRPADGHRSRPGASGHHRWHRAQQRLLPQPPLCLLLPARNRQARVAWRTGTLG